MLFNRVTELETFSVRTTNALQTILTELAGLKTMIRKNTPLQN